MISLVGIPMLLALCLLSSCTSVRVGPRVGTDVPVGSGGLNTVAGITAEGWYSPSGFVRVDPQVKVLYASKLVNNGIEKIGGYQIPTIDIAVSSRATFVELPIMLGFTLGDSARLRPIFAVGGSMFARIHSTTSSQGTIESVESPDEVMSIEINSTQSDNTMSDIGGSVFFMAGLTYAVTPDMDVRTEVRTSFLSTAIPFWDAMMAYTTGSPYTAFNYPVSSATFMISAVFHL